MNSKSFSILAVFFWLNTTLNVAFSQKSISHSDSVVELAKSSIEKSSIRVYGKMTNIPYEIKTLDFIVNNAITSYQEVTIAKIEKNGTFSVEIPVYHVIPELLLKIGDSMDSFLGIPGDSLELDISYRVGKANKHEYYMQFRGKNSAIVSEYYDYALHLRELNNKGFNLEKKTKIEQLSFSNYKTYRDSIRTIQDGMLLAYTTQHHSSETLKRIALLENKYAWANDLVSYGLFHKPGKFTKVDHSFFDFMNAGILNDSSALLAKDYPDFIKNYRLVIQLSHGNQELPMQQAIEFALKRDTLLSQPAKRAFNNYIKNGGYSNNAEDSQEMNKNKDNDFMLSFFNAYLTNKAFNEVDSIFAPGIGKNLALSNLLYSELMQDIPIQDSLLNRYYQAVTEKSISRPIFEKNIELAERFSASSKSNNFEGKKLNGPAKDLLLKLTKEHLGKVIYIDFWATWCAPCLQQMEIAKPLHKEFKDVVFLYLCSSSPDGKWKFVIKDRKIEGEHFLLDSEQFSYLSSAFNIVTVPRYLLVDKKGKMVSENAPSPSSGQTLKKVLARLSSE
ncbi:TlpA family protein disulfide reductase [Pedobacter sp. N36a]|uniref:TlpA family protein disulfide reductase n=1 Tax=Pedobacter sp. N36a TaxID=2767996 RepID=UPI0016570091|nr:TlpA disulfide reductase family protein [Pedobacter sp. N36a]MBC8988449.1 TlpA family protein disulfide reductase [Pedobacter sp. N36a]